MDAITVLIALGFLARVPEFDTWCPEAPSAIAVVDVDVSESERLVACAYGKTYERSALSFDSNVHTHRNCLEGPDGDATKCFRECNAWNDVQFDANCHLHTGVWTVTCLCEE